MNNGVVVYAKGWMLATSELHVAILLSYFKNVNYQNNMENEVFLTCVPYDDETKQVN